MTSAATIHNSIAALNTGQRLQCQQKSRASTMVGTSCEQDCDQSLTRPPTRPGQGQILPSPAAPRRAHQRVLQPVVCTAAGTPSLPPSIPRSLSDIFAAFALTDCCGHASAKKRKKTNSCSCSSSNQPGGASGQPTPTSAPPSLASSMAALAHPVPKTCAASTPAVCADTPCSRSIPACASRRLRLILGPTPPMGGVPR